mmetsp:Transcript_114107/g.227065  ORF Transcript_114107/g.227065 Transcript_114107/m.227065 type:complete len:236 (+) Transcript_114107:886-1593(+)
MVTGVAWRCMFEDAAYKSRCFNNSIICSWSCRYRVTNVMRSMLLALPFRRPAPTTSSSAVTLLSPPAKSSKSVSTSSTSRPIEESHLRTTSSSMTFWNSFWSKLPSPSLSAYLKSFVIFRLFSLMALVLLLRRIWSSDVATLKVSWMKTPVITETTEKPMKNLCHKNKRRYHSLTCSTRARVGTIQLPNVSSNIASIDLAKDPKCIYTSKAFSWERSPMRKWSSTAACSRQAIVI